MFHIGQKVPPFRTPAFMQGTLTLFDLAGCHTRWLALCGIPNFGLVEANFLDRHHEDFGRESAMLLALCPNAPTFHAPWIRQTPYVRIPMLADPLSRLHRALNISPKALQGQCCSVLIDPSGVLKVRLIHDLNGRGINALKEALIANQHQPVPLTHRSDVLIAEGAFTPCIL